MAVVVERTLNDVVGGGDGTRSISAASAAVLKKILAADPTLYVPRRRSKTLAGELGVDGRGKMGFDERRKKRVDRNEAGTRNNRHNGRNRRRNARTVANDRSRGGNRGNQVQIGQEQQPQRKPTRRRRRKK